MAVTPVEITGTARIGVTGKAVVGKKAVVVPPPAISIVLNKTALTVGQTVTATITGGPGDPRDISGLALVGSPEGSSTDFFYFNSTKTQPTAGVRPGIVTFTPPAPGLYEIRVRAYTPTSFMLAYSAPITVTAGTSATLLDKIAELEVAVTLAELRKKKP